MKLHRAVMAFDFTRFYPIRSVRRSDKKNSHVLKRMISHDPGASEARRDWYRMSRYQIPLWRLELLKRPTSFETSDRWRRCWESYLVIFERNFHFLQFGLKLLDVILKKKISSVSYFWEIKEQAAKLARRQRGEKNCDPRERGRTLEHFAARRVRWLFLLTFFSFLYNTFTSNERGASAVENLGSPRYWDWQSCYPKLWISFQFEYFCTFYNVLTMFLLAHTESWPKARLLIDSILSEFTRRVLRISPYTINDQLILYKILLIISP